MHAFGHAPPDTPNLPVQGDRSYTRFLHSSPPSIPLFSSTPLLVVLVLHRPTRFPTWKAEEALQKHNNSLLYTYALKLTHHNRCPQLSPGDMRSNSDRGTTFDIFSKNIARGYERPLTQHVPKLDGCRDVHVALPSSNESIALARRANQAHSLVAWVLYNFTSRRGERSLSNVSLVSRETAKAAIANLYQFVHVERSVKALPNTKQGKGERESVRESVVAAGNSWTCTFSPSFPYTCSFRFFTVFPCHRADASKDDPDVAGSLKVRCTHPRRPEEVTCMSCQSECTGFFALAGSRLLLTPLLHIRFCFIRSPLNC